MESVSESMVETLQEISRSLWGLSNPRYDLLGVTKQGPDSSEATGPYVQIQQLTLEVQYHRKKCSEALAKIEALIAEISKENELDGKLVMNMLPAISVDTGSEMMKSGQVCWPYRSRRVLDTLKLETTAEIVVFFEF